MTEKWEVLDLVIKVFMRHEKRLDASVTRLEAVEKRMTAALRDKD